MNDNPPVIIIGAARSGTKFLRDVLAASAHAKAVPYDVSYVWRYGNQSAPDDALTPSKLNEGIAAFVRKQLPRLAGIGPGEEITLIEKTVGNSLRVLFVNAIYPDAKFVHLVRDGRAVTESAMRMWLAPPNRSSLFQKLKTLPLRNYGYALWFLVNYVKGLFAGRSGGAIWGPRYPGVEGDVGAHSLERICARQWAESERMAHEQLSRLPQERVLTVHYEELVANEGVLKAVVDFAGLPDWERIVCEYRRIVCPQNDGKWRRSFSAAQLEGVLSEAGDQLMRLGYLVDNSK